MVLKPINGVAILALGARIGTLSSFSAAQGLEEGIKWEIPTTVKAVTGSPQLSASQNCPHPGELPRPTALSWKRVSID